MSLEKERGERKRQLIAHAWHVSNVLEHASSTIRAQIERCKEHEITEWDMTEAVHQEILTLFVECGLTELMEKFLAFALTEQAISYGRGNEPEATD